MKALASGLVLSLLTGVALTISAAPAGAAACTVRQLTDTTLVRNGHPSISDDGTVVAFSSEGDLESFGQNADANGEVYRLDLTSGQPPDQVTVSTGPAVGDLAMSGDGTRIAFESFGEYGDLGDNGDGSSEIWLYDTAVGTAGITQLTNTSRDSEDPAIDHDGTRIAFESKGDLLGDNPDERREIFLWDSATATTTQLTDSGSDDSRRPVIDDSGTRIAFQSEADLTGDDGDGGEDLFLVDTTAATTTQLVDSDEESMGTESMDAAGGLVTFVSEDDLTGANGDGGQEVFLHRIATGVTTQLTSNPDSILYSEFSDVDATGDRVAFASNADLTGGNPDEAEYQLFTRDRSGRVGTDQLTVPPGDLSDPAVSADGTRIAVEWSGDPLGTNADGNREIFLFTCGAAGPTYTDVPPGNFFYDQIEWMAAAEVANGFPNGTFKPGDAVKRQQMANFLFNLAGRPETEPPSTPTFTDVPATNPFFTQIEWMVGGGIANGFPGGLFKPNDPVKRQQMANFLYNLAGHPAFTPPATPTFTDVPASNPFFTQIEWMTAEGIANGFPGGLFKPNDPVKRQQMAQFLLNLVNGPGVDLD